jgi:hypothetical protein
VKSTPASIDLGEQRFRSSSGIPARTYWWRSPLEPEWRECDHDEPDVAREWRVVTQGEMGACLVVVFLIPMKQMANVPLAEHDDMIQTIPSD